jgi:hypothetical protein
MCYRENGAPDHRAAGTAAGRRRFQAASDRDPDVHDPLLNLSVI